MTDSGQAVQGRKHQSYSDAAEKQPYSGSNKSERRQSLVSPETRSTWSNGQKHKKENKLIKALGLNVWSIRRQSNPDPGPA